VGAVVLLLFPHMSLMPPHPSRTRSLALLDPSCHPTRDDAQHLGNLLDRHASTGRVSRDLAPHI
jgi:hypothetical protein